MKKSLAKAAVAHGRDGAMKPKPNMQVIKKQPQPAKNLTDGMKAEVKKPEGTPSQPHNQSHQIDFRSDQPPRRKVLPWWMRNREITFIKRIGRDGQVKVTLNTGVVYEGVITFWDVYSFSMCCNDGSTPIVFKRSLETIIPEKPITFEEEAPEGDKKP